MEHKIDLSPEALQERREIAEKATPGPWVEIVPDEGDFDDNATLITTDERLEDSKVEIASLELTCIYDDEINEFNLEQRANAAHIAANSPDAVIAMIDEIERLRNENAQMEKEADWLASCLIGNCPTFTDCRLRERKIDSECVTCWGEAARKAVEEQCKK